MRTHIGACFATLLCATQVTRADVNTISSVDAFDAFRAEHESFAVVIYAPWCGHSRALLPEFEKASKLSSVPFVKVDGTEAEELATKLDVKGYPTLLAIRRGDGPPIEYDGQRQAGPIQQWVSSKTNPEMKQLSTPSAVSAFAASAASVALVLLAADASGPEVEALRSVAASASDLRCAVYTGDVSDAALGLGTLSTPALVAYTKYDNSHVVMPPSLPLTHAAMLHFGKVHALPPVIKYSSAVEEALFSSEVGLHLLYFHAGEQPDESAARALAEAADALRGDAVVTTLSPSSQPEVATYFDVSPHGPRSTPALMGFSLLNGTKFAHTGELTAAAITSFAAAVRAGTVPVHLRSQPEPAEQPGPVVELVGSTFAAVALDPNKDVLVQMYAPDCGHCRKLRPVYEAVAAKLKGDDDLVVAQIDAKANDVLGFEPEGYPTIGTPSRPRVLSHPYPTAA